MLLDSRAHPCFLCIRKNRTLQVEHESNTTRGAENDAWTPTRRLLGAPTSAAAQQPAVQHEAAEQQAAFCRGLSSLDYPALQVEVAWAAPEVANSPAEGSISPSSSGSSASTGSMASVPEASAMRQLQHQAPRRLQQHQGDSAALRKAAWEHLVRGRHEMAAAEQQQSDSGGSSGSGGSGMSSYKRFSAWVNTLRGDESVYASDLPQAESHGSETWLGANLDGYSQRKRDRTRISLKENIRAKFSFGSAPVSNHMNIGDNARW